MSEKKDLVIREKGGLVPASMDELWRFADAVSKSEFGNGESASSIFVTIQSGMELGMSMMQARSAMYCVKGRPAIMGNASKALVYNSGKLKENTSITTELFNGSDLVSADALPLETSKWDNTIRAVASAHRVGAPMVQMESFSVADAKRMRLWGKGGPWTNSPGVMLSHRAWGQLARSLFPDVLMGLYTVEEARDFNDDYSKAKPVEAVSDGPSKPDGLLASLNERKPVTTSEAIDAVMEPTAPVDAEEGTTDPPPFFPKSEPDPEQEPSREVSEVNHANDRTEESHDEPCCSYHGSGGPNDKRHPCNDKKFFPRRTKAQIAEDLAKQDAAIESQTPPSKNEEPVCPECNLGVNFHHEDGGCKFGANKLCKSCDQMLSNHGDDGTCP